MTQRQISLLALICTDARRADPADILLVNPRWVGRSAKCRQRRHRALVELELYGLVKLWQTAGERNTAVSVTAFGWSVCHGLPDPKPVSGGRWKIPADAVELARSVLVGPYRSQIRRAVRRRMRIAGRAAS